MKIDELLISQPDHGEQALQIVEMLVRSQAVDLVVVDSVAALVPKAEVEGYILIYSAHQPDQNVVYCLPPE